MISDHELNEILHLMKQTEEGLRAGRIHRVKSIKKILTGLNREYVKHSKQLIDFDSLPIIPPGWTIRDQDQIETRLKGEWDINQINLQTHLSLKQRQGKPISGNDLRVELNDKPVIGANLLDLWLEKPGFIPREYLSKTVLFFGTIYSVREGLCVRYIHFKEKKCDWGSFSLERNLTPKDLIILGTQKRS